MGVGCKKGRSGGGGGTHREERDHDEAEQGDVARGDEEDDQRDERETWTAAVSPPPARQLSSWANAAPPDTNEPARPGLVRVRAGACMSAVSD